MFCNFCQNDPSAGHQDISLGCVTVDVELGAMGCLPHAVGRRALVRSSVLHLDRRDVYVTDDVPMARHILSYYKPVKRKHLTNFNAKI